MDTPSINGPGTGPRVIVKGQPKQQSGFSAALSEQATDHSRATNSRRSDFREAAPAARKRVQEPDLVRLGTITTSKPTVSHLLIDHPDYRSRCWNIIHSEQNRSKAYTKIQAGTAIYMDPNTLEVRWGKEVMKPTSVVGEREKETAIEVSTYSGRKEHNWERTEHLMWAELQITNTSHNFLHIVIPVFIAPFIFSFGVP